MPAPFEYFAVVIVFGLELLAQYAKTFSQVLFFNCYRKQHIMESNQKVTTILNDLIRINHDRIVGYEKAVEELKAEDADLKTLFHRYAQESRQYAEELTHEVTRLG